jgi:hypothetical protein
VAASGTCELSADVRRHSAAFGICMRQRNIGSEVRSAISDQDIAGFRAISSPGIQIAIDLAIAAGLSEANVINLSWYEVYSDSMVVRHGKSGKSVRIPLTSALKDALQLARNYEPFASSRLYLVRLPDGNPYSPMEFRTEWKRYMRNWRNLGGKLFHFRDLHRLAEVRHAVD